METKLARFLKILDRYSKNIVKIVEGRIVEVENDHAVDSRQIINAHILKANIMTELNSLKDSYIDLLEE